MRSMYRFVLLGFCACLVAGTAMGDGAALLTMLRARDAQFDNMSLTLERRYVHRADPHAFRESFPDNYERGPDDVFEPPVWDIVADEAITVRDREVTICGVPRPTEPKPWGPLMIGVGAGSVATNVDGTQRELSMSAALPLEGGAWSMVVSASHPYLPDSVEDTLMERELAMGYGYGERIVRLLSSEQTAEGWNVTAEMSLWGHDAALAELSIDNDLIVREARIVSRVGEGMHVFRVTTAGTQTLEGLAIADSGEFEWRRSPQATEDRAEQDALTVVDEYEVRPKAIQRNLSETDYARLVGIEVPEGTFVSDRISQIEQAVGFPDSRRAMVNPRSDKRGGS